MFQRAFSVSTREPAAPVFWAGGRLPHRGFVVCCNGGMFVRLTDCVSCAIRRARSFVCTIACVHDRGRAVPVAVVHGRAWPSCLWPWCRGRDHGRPGRPSCMAVVPWFLCRRRVVATRRWMLVFATVYVVSALSRLLSAWIAYIVGAIKQTTTKGTEMNERPPPRRPPPQGR